VRTFCEGAQKEFELSASEQADIKTGLESLPERYRFEVPKVAYEPMKMPTCPTGLRGRMAVFEVLEMSSELEKIILNDPIESKLWATARAEGMITMREDAMVKAFSKLVPFSEVNTLSTVMLESADDILEPAVETPSDGQKRTQSAGAEVDATDDTSV
jgi:type IV pilus assembly protein PilB